MQARVASTRKVHYITIELNDEEAKELERTRYLIHDEEAGLISNLVGYIVEVCKEKT